MSSKLVILFEEESVTFIRLDTPRRETAKVLESHSIALDFLRPQEATQEDKSDQEPSQSPPPVEPSELIQLREFLEKEEDEVIVAVLPRSAAIVQELEVPFREPKRYEQIIPMQLEDLVPFAIDEFIVDSAFLREQAEGEFHIVSALVPKTQIKYVLDCLSKVEVAPELVTLRAPLLVGALEEPDASAILIEVDVNGFSLVVLERGVVTAIREWRGRDVREHLLLTLGRITKREKEARPIFVIGDALDANTMRSITARPLLFKGERIKVNELYALGIHEIHEAKRPLINFRRGPFAYGVQWGRFLQAAKDQWSSFALAALCGVFWLGASTFSSASQLSRLDDAMQERIQTVFPSEAIPPGEETKFVTEKVDELENQLRALGSLSALSPLDSLKELSEVIPKSIDVALDGLTIGQSRLTFTGSVIDNNSFGKLLGALEKHRSRFCTVKVDSKGQMGNRVRFAADIKLCE